MKALVAFDPRINQHIETYNPALLMGELIVRNLAVAEQMEKAQEDKTVVVNGIPDAGDYDVNHSFWKRVAVLADFCDGDTK
jgi:hypothetical protein